MREINKTGNEFIFTRFIYTDDFHAICLYRSKMYESFSFHRSVSLIYCISIVCIAALLYFVCCMFCMLS